MLCSDDRTIAMDDIVCERWGGCTLCQRWPLWSVHTCAVHGLVVGACLCLDCFTGDKALVRLEAYLRQLYDPARWNGTNRVRTLFTSVRN
jgi:hypothetical protein